MINVTHIEFLDLNNPRGFYDWSVRNKRAIFSEISIDNSPDSSDSRYWGFVPGRFIVGVATRIIYCRDRQTERFRWDRLLKRI